jgi:hypothetical protein
LGYFFHVYGYALILTLNSFSTFWAIFSKTNLVTLFANSKAGHLFSIGNFQVLLSELLNQELKRLSEAF